MYIVETSKSLYYFKTMMGIYQQIFKYLKMKSWWYKHSGKFISFCNPNIYSSHPYNNHNHNVLTI